jgi:hypothetical protein
VDRFYLIIVNNGKRPVTIKRIFVKNPEDGWVGFNELEAEEYNRLPLKLTLGDEGTFVYLSEARIRNYSIGN